jgi:tetratricopeptide (TPR) repeat protein
MLDNRSSFNELKLRTAVNDYERVIRSSELLCKKGGLLASLLSTFYAMWSAFAVRLQFEESGEIATTLDETGGGLRSIDDESLPRLDTVRNAAERLMTALALHDAAEMYRALDEMGVLSLCRSSGEQLAKTEGVARRVAGRRQLILLVELALIATELERYDQARKYATEARAFHPTSWESYSLYMVEGLLALNANSRDKAVECLRESILACQSDEYTLLSCGVRVPNLVLVQKLLCNGERAEVTKHLLQCKDVWPFLGRRIDVWIRSIKNGSMPDTGISGVLNSLNFAYRLQMQWMRSLSLEDQQNSAPAKSATEAIAERERLRAEYKASLRTNKKP